MKDIEIALRNFKRNKTNTAIIIISLALGFACLNLITTFLARELRTDNFQVDKDRIYALNFDNPFFPERKAFDFEKNLEDYLKNNFAQIEDVCVYGSSHQNNEEVFIEDYSISKGLKLIETSSNFFTFFSYNLITGNPSSVLENKTSIVISDKLAKKYFGNGSPIGKIIEYQRSSKKYSCEITGIFESPNQNSQLDFDMVVKIQPNSIRRGYVKLSRSSNITEVQGLLEKYKSEIPFLLDGLQCYLQLLKKNYFDTSRMLTVDKAKSKTTIWIVACVGLLIMTLALFNFLGIFNHNLLERAKIYSIYQLNGASKLQLIKIVLTEIILLLSTSFFIGVVLVKWMLPIFNRLLDTSFKYNYTFEAFNFLFLLSILIIVFTTISLFVIYKLNLIKSYNILNRNNIKFQLPALNIFQLSVTILLLASSLMIIKQIQFIDNQKIGIDKQVINLSVPTKDAKNLEILKSKLLQFPTIVNVSRTVYSVFGSPTRLIKYNENGEEHTISSAIAIADEDFIKTLGIKVILGEDFSSDQINSKSSCLINDSMAKSLNRNNIIGSKLPDNSLTIIGVVEDYNFRNLKSIIYPAIIQPLSDPARDRASNLFIKVSDVQNTNSLNSIKQVWTEVFPELPFEYTTVEQQYKLIHSGNKKTIQLVVICCVVSILLSMMGLFAVVLQNSKLRTKEIGIRKVNGAKISEVMFLLNQDFIKWVIVAFIISTPLAFYTMYKWLQSFAYKTELSWWVFALAGLLALGIALLTVSFQSWKAATRNPVESLRYE